MKDDRIVVMLAINSLIIGGAEQQFLELVRGLDKKRFKAYRGHSLSWWSLRAGSQENTRHRIHLPEQEGQV